ncbi:hypothetical protein Y1Q_0022679 [Alligator mississippiensis]|uniref:Uncharacterized protein n=1 Tax=Alligator mississippiensis TaxID=8496 RepID=A0A151PHI2_ALLMI|nr:hypothetical protein Y1Q_0022679 [Alligator mississippiensis]
MATESAMAEKRKTKKADPGGAEISSHTGVVMLYGCMLAPICWLACRIRDKNPTGQQVQGTETGLPCRQYCDEIIHQLSKKRKVPRKTWRPNATKIYRPLVGAYNPKGTNAEMLQDKMFSSKWGCRYVDCEAGGKELKRRKSTAGEDLFHRFRRRENNNM